MSGTLGEDVIRAAGVSEGKVQSPLCMGKEVERLGCQSVSGPLLVDIWTFAPSLPPTNAVIVFPWGVGGRACISGRH